MLSSRGQSFDVFQLLIAAIVAGAILVILLNIITIITPPGSNIAADATSLVKTGLTSSYGSPVHKSRLTIESQGILSPVTIAKETDISASDICVSAGDFMDQETLFKPVGRGGIQYLGSGKKQIGLNVVCGRGQDLADGLGYISNYDSGWLANCGGDGGSWECDPTANSTSNQTCCVVALSQS